MKGMPALLVTQFQFFDHVSVPLDIEFFKVIQQSSSLPHHLQKTAAGVIVLSVFLEMIGESLDASGQDSDLYFRGTSIGLVLLELLN